MYLYLYLYLLKMLGTQRLLISSKLTANKKNHCLDVFVFVFVEDVGNPEAVD